LLITQGAENELGTQTSNEIEQWHPVRAPHFCTAKTGGKLKLLFAFLFANVLKCHTVCEML
jgi:hypothetical protein